ncbi:hypothetical protein [Ramlibacter sp.]|uniref:hypothetical protein n=1 Tax=Ramlibacter sp. TaxID=1917967 RepID=UPI003D0CC137
MTIRGTFGLGPVIMSRQMTGPQAWALIEPVRCALQRLLDGVGDGNDLGGVGLAVNLAWLRCKKIGNSKAAMGVLEQGSAALLRFEDAAGPEGGPLLEPERNAVLIAVDLYETILRKSSLRQWAEAEVDMLSVWKGMKKERA